MIENKILALCQDQEGYLWIGTQNGLQRYDGCRFKTWLADIRDTASLQSDIIGSIFEDSKKRLWIGTDHGAPYVLDRATGRFYNYNLHADPANKINGIWHFAEDREGNIWIAGHEGYYKLNKDNNQFIKQNDQFGLAPTVKTGYLTIDEENNFWLCTTEGIKFYNTKEKKLYDKKYNPNHNPLFDINEGAANLVKSGHAIWMSTAFNRHLYRYDIVSQQLRSYSFERRKFDKMGPEVQKEVVGEVFALSDGQIIVPLPARGFAFYHAEADSFEVVNADNTRPFAYHVNELVAGDVCLVQDRDHNIIIGNENGINICNPDKLFIRTYGASNGIDKTFPPEPVSDFLELPDKSIYISYYSVNGGIVKTDNRFRFISHYLFEENGVNNSTINQLWNLFRDKDGMIWAPNQRYNILKLDPVSEKMIIDKDSSFGGAITIIRQEADGTIWFGCWKNGLGEEDVDTHTKHFYKHFLQSDNGPVKRVLSLLVDSDKIWVGTAQNGLQVFDKRSREFVEAFLPDAFNNDAISSNSVNDIIHYSKDTLVLSTEMGVNIFDTRQKKFTAITMKDGLPNNLVLSVIRGMEDDVWAIFSSGGFCKINMKTLAVTTYDIDDGILDNEFSCRFSKLSNGNIVVGTNSGNFISFDPTIVNRSSPPTKVSITGFSVFGRELNIRPFLDQNKPLKLSFKENSLRIEFASLQIAPAGRIKYYYKLEGADKDWISADKEQAAVYNRLGPGHYVFMVKCANRDGIYCNEVTSLKIMISPPFWKTWWFITLISLLIILSIIRFVGWRENNIRVISRSKNEMMAINEKLSEAKLEALRSQMNPHFIFNSLNAIQECILTGKVDAAYTYLSQFSKLQRLVLNNSAKEFIPLSAELEMLKLYLSLESLRFSQSFSYTIDAEKIADTDDVMVPSMLIQPFVENAIWHGLRNKDGEKILHISCEEQHNILIVTVDDNGIGRQQAALIKLQKLGSGYTESKGIALSQQRIEMISLKYKTNVLVDFTDKMDDQGKPAGTRVNIRLPLDASNIKSLS